MISEKVGRSIGNWLKVRLAQELKDQGHHLTGSLISSLEEKVSITGGRMIIEMLGNDYGDPLNTGVPASRIPYTPGQSRGATSKYIEGLIRFAERRFGLRGKEATSAAFAIARKHKREGMPTQGSYRYSSNGRRTGWIDVILADNDQELTNYVEEWVGQEVTILITNFSKARI
jgi:hypothetical protein